MARHANMRHIGFKTHVIVVEISSTAEQIASGSLSLNFYNSAGETRHIIAYADIYRLHDTAACTRWFKYDRD